MNKLLLLLLCIIPSLLTAATGDLTVRIRPDGWTAEVTSAGFTTGATYAFGLATNNVPGTSTPYLTVVSEGYDNATALGTITRTVHIVSTIRLPYASKSQPGGTWSGTFADGETITCSTSGATAVKVGDQAAGAAIVFKSLTGTPLTTQTWTGGTSGATFVNTSSTITTYTVPTKDEKATGTALVTLVALSDYIFVDDNTGGGKSGTTPTVTIPASFITNTGGASQASNALAAAAVTQNSTVAYSACPAMGSWAWPGFQRWDATSKLRVVAFDRNARNGRPVAAVKFTVTDTHSHTYTEIVTAPSFDPSVGDASAVIEYVTTGDITSGLTQGDTLTANFIAYPWVGDAGSILDSSAGTAAPTPLVGPITGVCDSAGTYGVTCALVDDATGSDAGALTVYDSASFNPATAYKFLTIAKAARAIRDYNNANHSRDRVDAGEIHCNAGTYAWLGATISGTYGATATCWITVKPAAGVARASVEINATSGNTDISDRVKLENVTIDSTTNNTFAGCLAMWLDQCVINSSSGTGIWNDNLQNVWVTRCPVPVFLQGFRPAASTTTLAFPLIRGCDLSGYTRGMQCYTVIGNVMNGNVVPAVTTLFYDQISNTMSNPVPTSLILAYNQIYGWNQTTGVMCDFGQTSKIATRGYAIVGNVFESTGPTSGNTICDVGSGEGLTTNTPVDNVIIWHNTFMGVRENGPYNSSGSTVKFRRYWSIKNNIYYDWNTKNDDFTGDLNGLRIGSWPCLYGVGMSGNVLGDSGNHFNCDFSGLSTINTDWGTGSTAPLYFQFVNYLASNEDVAGAGGGDYRLQTGSPAYRLQRDWVLPYGLGGKSRSGNSDSAGASAEGGVRPASMMFAQ